MLLQKVNHRDMVSVYNSSVQLQIIISVSMKDIGIKTDSMDIADALFLIKLLMKGIWNTTQKMVQVNIFGQMETNTMDPGRTTVLKAVEASSIMMYLKIKGYIDYYIIIHLFFLTFINSSSSREMSWVVYSRTITSQKPANYTSTLSCQQSKSRSLSHKRTKSPLWSRTTKSRSSSFLRRSAL